MTRDIPKDRLIICPVRTLVVGDVVRDFHAADPMFGEVKAPERNGFLVRWDDGTERIMYTRVGTHRADIIRVLRDGEVVN